MGWPTERKCHFKRKRAQCVCCQYPCETSWESTIVSHNTICLDGRRCAYWGGSNGVLEWMAIPKSRKIEKEAFGRPSHPLVLKHYNSQTQPSEAIYHLLCHIPSHHVASKLCMRRFRVTALQQINIRDLFFHTIGVGFWSGGPSIL